MMTSFERVPSMEPHRAHLEALDVSEKMVEKFMGNDNSFPTIFDKMRISSASGPTLSGLQENEYPPSLASPIMATVNHCKLANKVPLPPEILEQCCNINKEYSMGLFSDIKRAWLTVDTDIYLWDFETGGDVAYYDSLNEMIVTAGLVRPKPGVFQNHIKRLLVLTTSIEIVVLGVSLIRTSDNKKQTEELQLTQDIIYSLTTDGIPVTTICGTKSGRIFLGGKDGSLFEIVYQKEIGFWGKRCKKVNHSKGTFSYLIPSFLNSAFCEEDPMLDIAVDDSRNILYTLTEKGTIDVYDLGANGESISRVATMTYSSLLSHAATVLSTLDPREIANLVALCPLELSDSAELGLVVVSSSGVRVYMSTGAIHPNRPYTLQLGHVRLPPGFAATSLCLRPNQVIAAEHIRGTFIYVTTHRDAPQDKIWCLSGDPYISKPYFAECCSCSTLSGQAIAAVVLNNEDNRDQSIACPILVYQQNKRPDRIVLLTQQGAEIYDKIRPVDVLMELLRDCSGPENEIIKNYFNLQGADQACATALIIACNHNNNNVQMANWATRAFLIYGGDPKCIPQQLLEHQQPSLLQYSLPAGFKPNTVSTPLGNKASLSPTCNDNLSIQMSSKHNGLYLHLCRILRPIWFKNIVQKMKMADGKEYLISNIFAEQLARIASQLLALRTFLEKNTQISCTPGGSATNMRYQGTPIREVTTISPTAQRNRMSVQEAIVQEKHSLESFKYLVDYSTQVINFWRIMCEHQFHVIVKTLSTEQQNQLLNAKFRDLVTLGQELCTSLINALINIYLSDSTSVDSISSKLREVCPSLFKSEDAACSKANEILQLAKDQQDPEEKLMMLKTAIQLCKDVSPKVNLTWVCKQLTMCKYYEGVLELCLDSGSKLDPNNLAEHFYCKNQPPEDAAGYKAYVNRLTAYKEVTQMLDHLYQQCQFGGNVPVLSPDSPASTQSQKILQDVLAKCLEVNDEILQIVCYEWLIARNLHASLVTFGRPSLERYLGRFPLDPNLRDLLWQYHEKNGNHAAAAQLLYALATSPTESLKLHQRLTYLGKAVMCMRSDGAGCAPHLGVFLHELEDMVQVARVQKQVLDKVQCVAMREERAEEAIKRLNASLFTITELFEQFADPLDLWECKLTILDCAGHDDRELINSIWDNIIAEEVSKCNRSNGDDQMTVVMGKIKELGIQYTVFSPCFPLSYLVWQLEMLSCRLDVNKNHVHSVLISIGVDVGSLLEIYSKMFSVNDRCWKTTGNEYHLIQVIASFADSFLLNPRSVSASERKAIAVRMHDLITNCLSTLYSKSDTKQLVSYLKTIQTNLNHI